MKTVSITELRANFSALVGEAEAGATIIITRRGVPAAVLVEPDKIEELRRLRATGPDGGLASLAGGWEGSDDFVASLEESTRTIGRSAPEPG